MWEGEGESAEDTSFLPKILHSIIFIIIRYRDFRYMVYVSCLGQKSLFHLPTYFSSDLNSHSATLYSLSIGFSFYKNSSHIHAGCVYKEIVGPLLLFIVIVPRPGGNVFTE
jgi:hypothetical protein